MNAPPFPLNPGIGDWFGNWVWNGGRWVASPTTGLRVLIQTFWPGGGGPYMPSPGLVSLVVECVGGGGGGGGALAAWDGNTANEDWLCGGGGGASGCYSRKALPAALVRGGVLVTIGAGGAGGGPSSSGAKGGDTSFGALCVASGGNGGDANNFRTLATPENLWGGGGSRQPTTGGDIGSTGNAGLNGSSVLFYPNQGANLVAGGIGGASYLGGASVGSLTGANAFNNGGNGELGSGGAGGASGVSTMPANGGAGGGGACVVTEYCWGDRDQPLSEWSPPMNVNLNVRSQPPKPWPPGQPGPWWPPGWPPGWGPNPPWPPGWTPGPWPRGMLPQGQEFEAGAEPFSQDQDPEDP